MHRTTRRRRLIYKIPNDRKRTQIRASAHRRSCDTHTGFCRRCFSFRSSNETEESERTDIVTITAHRMETTRETGGLRGGELRNIRVSVALNACRKKVYYPPPRRVRTQSKLSNSPKGRSSSSAPKWKGWFDIFRGRNIWGDTREFRSLSSAANSPLFLPSVHA